MGTTPTLGLRFPEPTDRLNQVAQYLEDLALDVEAQLLGTVGSTAADPVVRQGASLWASGDFGDGSAASGDTQGWYRKLGGWLDYVAKFVQNGNGPTFPPTAAAPVYVDLPVASAVLSNRMVIGSYEYRHYSGGLQSAGTIMYDVATGRGFLQNPLNSNNQYSLAFTLRYPLVKP